MHEQIEMENIFYYLRSCHTFLRLNNNLEEAMIQLKREFDNGESYGSLCTNIKDPALKMVHAGKSWDEFKPIAEEWLKKAFKII